MDIPLVVACGSKHRKWCLNSPLLVGSLEREAIEAVDGLQPLTDVDVVQQHKVGVAFLDIGRAVSCVHQDSIQRVW